MVIAYDPDAVLTYVVPTMSLLQSIADRVGLEDLSLDCVFSLKPPTLQQPILEQLAPHGLTQATANHTMGEKFSAELLRCTSTSIDKRRFYRTSQLCGWLQFRDGSGKSRVQTLLEEIYCVSAPVAVPIDGPALCDSESPSLLAFSMLFELGCGDLIHKFYRSGLTDRQLPFASDRLRKEMDDAQLHDRDRIISRILELQWAYNPVVFEVGMELSLRPEQVVTVVMRERINDKSSSSRTWKVLVPEDCLGHRLRESSGGSRVKHESDGCVCLISLLI